MRSLCGPCAVLVRSLCTPCAPPVQPLCNCLRNPLFWPLRNLGSFEIDLGYCSTRSKDTAPQNQKILLHTQRKSWWDTAPQLSKDTAPHFKKKVKDTPPLLFLGHFAKVAFFFRGPVGRVPIKIFFCRGCQNLSWIKRVDYITSVFTHRSRRFRKLPSKTVPLWPDTL